MKRVARISPRLCGLTVVGLLAQGTLPPAWANPQGATVGAGSATITSAGSQLTIHTSDKAFISWSSFNIGLGESTTFVQPSTTSVVWNRINDANPSQILGSLNANGYVVLQNQSGFYIGGQASINTGGLVLTTSPMPPPDLFGGGAWQFDALPPSAAIINYGQINVGAGGSAFLIALDIENHGSINAPGGNLGLYAGKDVLVSERADGRGLSAQVNLPVGSVDNSGKLIADAGTIALNAQVVNQGGLIQANSVREVNGVIQIVASDTLTLGATSDIEARGDTSSVSAGGNVQLKSANTFQDAPTSIINVSGGSNGGNGGQVEISAPRIGAIQSQVQGGALAGWQGGQLSIDPQNIVLTSSGGTAVTGSGSSVTVGENDPPTTGTLTLNIGSFATFSQILLQASLDITLASAWTLANSSDPNATLTLEAGRNILFNANTSISAGKNWTVDLYAGADFTKSPGSVIAGAGSVDLTGSSLGDGTGKTLASVHTQNGSLNVDAGQSIFVGIGNLQTTTGALNAAAGQTLSISSGNAQTTTGALTVNVGQDLTIGSGNLQTTSGALDVTAVRNVTLTSGAIRTVGGGSIDVQAVAGNVYANANAVNNTTTTDLPGYLFQNGGTYSVSTLLAGIGTVAGGDVTIKAGQNVSSFLPLGTSVTDGGSGAFGPSPGVVTVTAGGSVYGHFVAADSERNGQIVASSITAGGDAGGDGGPLLALSLVRGGWNVTAGGSIGLQEVRNPSGVFSKASNGQQLHLFDYDPDSYVDLSAGLGVELDGGGPRYGAKVGGVSLAGIYIYPPSLTIDAGLNGTDPSKNGITFDAQITLYPSATGELNLKTVNGGSLIGTGSQATPDLLMSDSSATTYSAAGTFGITDHASSPIESGNKNAAVLNIDGDVKNFFLVTAKETQITVGGNWQNSYFQGQNLNTGDTTSINVTGQIILPNSKSFYPLGTPLSDTAAAELSASFLDSLIDQNGNQIFSSSSGTVAPTFYYTPGSLTLAAGQVSVNQFNALVSTDTQGNQTLKTFYLPQFIDGIEQIGANGKPVADTTQPITILSVPILQYFQANSVNVSVSTVKPADGLILGGPGTFSITAGSVDLGYSLGIQTIGPGYSADGSIVGNSALVKASASGADIKLQTLAGDITMFSSTIATSDGGNITITAAGAINVGSSSGLGLQNPTSGIFAAGPGNVSITANGTIDVSGSRVATFGGGNIDLASATGDVNAGNGAANDLQVNLSEIDPVTGAVLHLPNIFNGSGILAYTLPLTLSSDDGSVVLHFSAKSEPGNITITTPQGSIIAGEGGIVQEPLNGNESSAPTVTLTAGTHNGSSVSFAGDIDLSGSGVIGGTIKLDASRNITGLVIGRGDTSVNAVQNFSGTLLSGGTASLSAGGLVSGTIIGVSGINVGGGATVEASLLSQNVSVGGAQAAGLATTATASAASQSASQEATAQAKDSTGQDTSQNNDDDEKKKRGQRVLLAKSTGRVTVILPK